MSSYRTCLKMGPPLENPTGYRMHLIGVGFG